MTNNNTDNALIDYANEEDKWNSYVDKTIDFNTNYSIFTSKKDVVNNNINIVNTNDNELSDILKQIEIKNSEIIYVNKVISEIDAKITEAIDIQRTIIESANDDTDLDIYDINGVARDKKIDSYDTLTTYRKETQNILNNISNSSSYKNKSIDELTTMITDIESKNRNIINDLNSIPSVIKLIDNNTKHKTYNKITGVPIDTNLYSKYNLYNSYIVSLKSNTESLNTKNSDKSTSEGNINTDNSTLRSTTKLLNSKNAELTSKNAELISKKQQYDAKTAEVKIKNDELKSKNTEFNNLNCSKVKNKTNCNEKEKKLKDDIKSLNSTIKDLNSTIISLNTDIKTLKNTTIPGINTNISTYTTTINTANSNISKNTILLSGINNSIIQLTTSINSIKSNISSVKNDILEIQTQKNANTLSFRNEINIYKNSRLYNRYYIRLNKIIDYINKYNSYDIPALNKKKSDQQEILKSKQRELDNVLIPQKNNKITELNSNMKTCKTNKDDLNSKLTELQKNINVCNDADMCTNKCAKNILCKVNDMFCSDDSWYSIIKKQYLEYVYDVSCSKIVNKNIITEPFINKMDMNIEGFQQIYVNPNIDADISYTNYYSKFINNTLHPEDVSQNILNLKRNIEIDTYFYLKYNAQIEVLKYIIIVCCVSLIGSVFYHNGLITNDIYTGYLSLVFALGIVYIIYKIYDIYIRDNINFSRFAYEKLFTPYNNVNDVNDFNISGDCEK